MDNKLKVLKQNFEISNFEGKTKADIEKTGKKDLLNIFLAIDSDGDGTLNSSEVSIFKKVIESADTDGDKNITKKELNKLLKGDSDFVKKLLANGKVKASNLIDFISSLTAVKTAKTTLELPEYQIQQPTVKDSQDSAIEMIQNEVDRGYEIFNEHENGVFAKTYDEMKELFGAKLSKSSVAKNLFIKNETAELLRRAKAGTLTKSEYYNIIKENLMQTFPGVEEMNEEELQKLADMINSLSPERVEQIQKKILALPSPDSEEYDSAVQEFGRNFVAETCIVEQDTNTINQDGISSGKSKVTYKPNSAYQLEEGNELMSFEKVYKLRNGIEFNQEKVENYNRLSSQYGIQQSFNELKEYVHGVLDRANSDSKIEKSILEILSSLSQAKDDDALTKILRHMTGINDVSVVSGKIMTTDMQALKQALLSKIDAQVDEINGGKSFEEITAEMEKAYKEAYGEENVELLAKAYVQEQEKFVKTTRTVIEIGGAAASIIGMFCCPPLAIGAGIAGSLGGVGFEMLEEATKDNKSKEKIETLKKELAMNIALFAAGMGSGIAGSAVGAVSGTLAKKCPVLISLIAERGTDATLSLISTMAITGELDLAGVSLSQVLAVVAGLKGAKVGVKNAAAEPDNLGIIPWANKKPGIFSKFFGPQDINPNSPLNKYKPSKSRYTMSHNEFYAKNPHLFQGTHNYGCWAGKESSDPHHGAWKMHLYSVSEEDWQRMADVIIPYLREHDIDWKTFNSASGADYLNGSSQQGKAFTIYPRNNADFEKIARDLDYIIRNNNLNTTNTHIEGDKALGSTGRIFYRYEFKSKKDMHEVLDLSKNSPDWDKYYNIYDGNSDRINRHGHGRYLADDMTPADDPWYNFDPSKPANKANNSSVNNNYASKSKMVKNQYYEVNGSSRLNLPDGAVIDFSDSYIQSRLAQVPEGQAVYVGRSPDCFIRIRPECEHVSNYHLLIYKQNGRIYVQDISTNGTDILRR